MAGEHSLTTALRSLILRRRTASLGTLGEDGLPFVSFVPFAVEPRGGDLVIHISGLAAHTRNLALHPQASLLIAEGEPAQDEPVHALPRLTLQVDAITPVPGSSSHERAREAYLGRFPEVEPMTTLADFRFVVLQVATARQIAGFGAARSLDGAEVRRALQHVG